MKTSALLNRLNTVLQPHKIKDYCPNGLQIEGRSEVKRLVTGVTASLALIEKAIELNADAILVHHGFFWKGEQAQIVGMKKKRFSKILSHDLNVFAYHLPLDVHPTLGNNAQLALKLGIVNLQPLEKNNVNSVAMVGELTTPITHNEFAQRIAYELNRKPLDEGKSDKIISSVALCTGGGQGFIEKAAEQSIDAFLTGEVSEQTIHVAREMNISFYAAGHHATERYGAKALGEHIQESTDIECIFVDIDNPA